MYFCITLQQIQPSISDMEYLQVILFVIILIAVLYFGVWQKHAGRDKTESKDKDSCPTPAAHTGSQTEPTADFTGMKTHDLCKALLHELNCKVTVAEDDDDRMEFTFQGETFCLIASDDCLLVSIYDFSWGSVQLDDIDEVSRLRKAINSVNFNFGGLAIVYSIDTESNRMVVHTKRQILVTPEIPNIIDYITAMLTGFFEIKRALTHELDVLRIKATKDK